MVAANALHVYRLCPLLAVLRKCLAAYRWMDTLYHWMLWDCTACFTQQWDFIPLAAEQTDYCTLSALFYNSNFYFVPCSTIFSFQHLSLPPKMRSHQSVLSQHLSSGFSAPPQSSREGLQTAQLIRDAVGIFAKASKAYLCLFVCVSWFAFLFVTAAYQLFLSTWSLRIVEWPVPCSKLVTLSCSQI